PRLLATMRKTAKIIVITAILDATQTNRAKPAAMRISAQSASKARCVPSLPKSATNRAIAPTNCAITAEKNRGGPIARKPSKGGKDALRPLSQPRPMERVSRVVARETLLVIEWDLQTIRERKAEQFFFGLSARADQP